MLCREAKVLLADLSLGDLPAARRTEVEAHLSSCASCRARVEAIGESVEALRRAADEERRIPVPPVDLSRILPKGTSVPLLRRILRASGRIAAVLLCAIGLASLLSAEARTDGRSLTLSFALPGTGARNTPGIAIPPLALEVSPLIRREVEAALLPAFRGIATWMVESEERHAEAMSLVARWLDERRVNDARLLASALASTREGLSLTQEAMLEVAGRLPDRRPGW